MIELVIPIGLFLIIVIAIMLTDKKSCRGCFGTGSNGVHMSSTGPCEICGGTGKRDEKDKC